MGVKPLVCGEVDRRLLAGLSCFQRLLLITDGTVTDMLEQYLQEDIQVLKLHEAATRQVSLTYHPSQCLDDYIGTSVLERKVLLQGQRTQVNWVYAESVILLAHLPAPFYADLLGLQEPIGRLWERHRVETFKEILCFSRFRAGDLADHFKVSPEVEVVARTYAVYSGGRLIMLITEIFPVTFFLQ